MKRMSALLLIICLAISIAPPLRADGAYGEGDYTFYVTDEGAFITYFNETVGGNVTVPSTLGGNPVVGIGSYAFQSCYEIKSIKLPEGITEIGEYAFNACESLESVSLPSTLEYIGASAFYFCPSLEEVTIPESVSFISGNAFYACTSLTDVYFESTEGWITNNVQLESELSNSHTAARYLTDTYAECAWVNDVTEYLDYYLAEGKATVFNRDKSIGGDIVIPATIDGYPVESIVDFQYCNYITGLTVSYGVESFAFGAFMECENLKSVWLSNSITVIYDAAFNGCRALESINIPDSLVYLGSSLVRDTELYKNEDNWENGALYLDSCLMAVKTELSGTYEVKDGTAMIAPGAFGGCTELTNVIIPDSVKQVGENPFWGTAYYNDADNWENDVLYVGKHLIEAKTTLTGDYEIKEGTLTVADCAFSEERGTDYITPNITSLTVPASVTYIGHKALAGCYELESVYFENTEGWATIDAPIASSELEDPQAAVEYLTAGHCLTCREVVYGDVDGKSGIGASDAIYLLYHVFFGAERYPLNQYCDFDKNGTVEAADAIYLLYHVFFGAERYPLD